MFYPSALTIFFTFHPQPHSSSFSVISDFGNYKGEKEMTTTTTTKKRS
jgi:hypothetical protein